MIATYRITVIDKVNKDKKSLINNYMNDILIFKNKLSKIFSSNYIEDLFLNKDLSHFPIIH